MLNISKEYKYVNIFLAVIFSFLLFAPLTFSIPGIYKAKTPFQINPPECFFKQHTGESCIGCGLTRSIAVLYEGKFSLSKEHHPIGYLVVIIILVELLLRINFIFVKSEWYPWFDILQMLIVGLSFRIYLAFL